MIEWKRAPEFPDYEVSSDGQVRSNKRAATKALRMRRMPNGYARYALFRDRIIHYPYAHRLLWEAFVGPIPPKLQINHINGDKLDNRLENLEVVTSSENNRHKFAALGITGRRGSQSNWAILTEADVPAIRALAASGLLQREIAERFGVGREAISKILLGQRWAHVI